MGTEKDKIRSVKSNRPPPIPPRPQHLIPVKAISKYSSMPDILNGWKKDTNPDLLKINGAGGGGDSSTVHNGTKKSSLFSISREYRVKNVLADKATAANTLKTYTYNGNTNGDCNYDYNTTTMTAATAEKAMAAVNGKSSSKKFSCIPSRNNSKKKKNILSSINVCTNGNANTSNSRAAKNNTGGRNGHGNGAEISQTSWYVEDVGNTMVQLSKCEITLKSDNPNSNNCRYKEQQTAPVTVSTNTATLIDSNNCNFVNKQQRYRRFHMPMTSSSSLSGLPPLPKSLSDASLLWESADKKLSSYSINLSSSSSNASSCSRSSGSSHHSKVPASPSSKTSTASSTAAAVAAVTGQTQQPDGNATGEDNTSTQSGDTVPRDDQRPTPPPPPPRKPTSLDMKLAILRKEMHDLRQMDLSLLSQLWSLNEAIHEFRQMQESLSPHTPSSHSSDEDDLECYYSNVDPQAVINQSQNTTGSNSSRSSANTPRTNIRDT